MIEMLADIVRQRKREELRSCLAICISVDDKSPWRDISYRAVLADLSVVKIGEAMTRDTLDDDKCKAYADSILQAWRLFCTPRSCDEDTALFKHILTSIDCPNLNFIYGDPCHVIRSKLLWAQEVVKAHEGPLGLEPEDYDLANLHLDLTEWFD
ncbi:unnamed protein product, partial [Effrenium voratum]